MADSEGPMAVKWSLNWLGVIRAGPIRSENNLVLSAVFRLCRIMPGEDQGWKSWSDAVEFCLE